MLLQLREATPWRSIEIFQYLILHGANVHLCAKAEGVGGYSVLHATAWEGNIKAAQILIDEGVDVDLRNVDGVTPLKIAKIRNNAEFVEYLISLGATA